MGDHDHERLKYLVSFQAGVLLPLAQGALIGLAAGVLTLCAALVLHVEGAWAWAGAVAALAFGGAVLVGVSWWRGQVETRQPAPAAAPQVVNQVETVRVQVVSSDPSGAYQAGVWADLPISKERLEKVARLVMGGAGFGHNLSGPNKVLSRGEFEGLRDEFIRRGLAVWKHGESHNQGVDLTLAGRAVLRRFSGLVDRPAPPAPPPHKRPEPAKPDQAPAGAYTHIHTNDQARPVDQAPAAGVLADPMRQFRGDVIVSRQERLARSARLAAADPGGRPGR